MNDQQADSQITAHRIGMKRWAAVRMLSIPKTKVLSVKCASPQASVGSSFKREADRYLFEIQMKKTIWAKKSVPNHSSSPSCQHTYHEQDIRPATIRIYKYKNKKHKQ